MPKLLIVDDEIDIREFAKNYFKKRQRQSFAGNSAHLCRSRSRLSAYAGSGWRHGRAVN